MNIRTLIIPDLHLKWQTADKIINHVAADKIVFLGDYFDDFGDDYRDNLIMAEWLAASLEQSNRIHCMGNHDINYAIPHRAYKCSGYEAGKDYAINSVLKEKDWKKLKLFTWVGSWLCSHAGLHKYFYTDFCGQNEFKPWLENICDEAMENAFGLRHPDPILRAGYSRGGNSLYGGIMWCDRKEFVPINGVNQIFGHTPCKKPIWIVKNDPNSADYTQNLSLDVSHAQYYAIHDSVNDKVTIHWIGDM